MENIFNPTRFGNLVNKHFREHLRTYLMSLLVFGAVIIAIYMFMAFMAKGRPLDINVQITVFALSFWLGICVFAGTIFSDYNHSRSAFTTIMLPASVFEKYLLYWLVSLVGFTVLALGAYHLAQSIVIEYLKTQGIESPAFYIWNPGKEGLPIKLLIGLYILSHSTAFLGAISFRKRTVIITATVALATIMAYGYLNYQVRLFVLNDDSATPAFFPTRVITSEGWAEINAPNNELWATIVLSTLILLFWICAYFKLKERQV